MPDIFALADAAVDRLAILSPITATAYGLEGRHDAWDDLSPDGVAGVRNFYADLRAEAETCETPEPRHQLAKRVLVDECDRELQAIEHRDWASDLNNLASPWQVVREVFSIAPRISLQDWTDTAVRLETIDQPLAGYRACLEVGVADGTMAAARQVRTAIEQGRQAAGDSSSFDGLVAEWDASELAAGDDAAAFRARLVAAVSSAKAAYGDMTDWFETTYLPAAPTADGVGTDRYVRAASRFLGTTIDPATTYAWGWTEVERLGAALADACARIDPDASVDEVFELLTTDPSRCATDVEEFLAIMQRRQDQAMAALDGVHFDVDPRIRALDVVAAPPGGAAAPHYMAPSEDFSKPGQVRYPIAGREIFPLFDEISTAYHEGLPGHHLQIGAQATMGDALSRYHRLLVWYPGSGEGWALYAEHLMGELGAYEKPDYEVGLLLNQLFRACRIVIDIGLHCGFAIPVDSPFHPSEPWSYDLVVEMLLRVARQPWPMAESEAVRYLGWPGQAISYKLGEKAILDLRAELEQRPDFDRKAFHSKVLACGAIGIDLLRELVLAD